MKTLEINEELATYLEDLQGNEGIEVRGMEHVPYITMNKIFIDYSDFHKEYRVDFYGTEYKATKEIIGEYIQQLKKASEICQKLNELIR